MNSDDLKQLNIRLQIVNYYMVYYHINNIIHRIINPAIINRDGDKLWLINDYHNRLNGPSKISKNGVKYWYKDVGLVKVIKFS